MRSKARGVIVITALPPTMGHAALIEFGAEFMRAKGGLLHVLVNTHKKEPFGMERFLALRARYSNDKDVVVTHAYYDGPNQPIEGRREEFWKFWRGILNQYTDVNHKFIKGGEFFIFASEKYGIEFSKEMGAQFIPFDPGREMNSVSGTKLRESGKYCHFYWKEIIPEFRWVFNKTVTVFGADSCGKSTLTKYLGGEFTKAVEWARPYLETIGSDLTTEKMETIVYGQYALQLAAEKRRNSMVIIQDTDLLSTIGYYRIFKHEAPLHLVEKFYETRSDLYILCSTNGIPFHPDPLRYGGDHRESNDQFWIDLLKEFNCRYEVVTGSGKISRYNQASKHINNLLQENPIFGFKRENNEKN